MATGQPSKAVQHLRRAVLLQDGAGLTDGELLACFVEHRDDAAFAALVRRHGPMVWGVCRRLLNHHDAEDACQAAFLVLVRKAAFIRPREMVANWLYGVAHQAALQARRTVARRGARERQVEDMPEPAVTGQDRWDGLRPLLDQELSRLPDRHRVVVVLCDLEGKTRKEAAQQLGCPEGTVASRLARARAMLAERLARHGLAVVGGALPAVLSREAASACVPAAVVSDTIKAASLLAAGEVAAGVISTRVATLAQGVLKMMLLTKLKVIMAVLLVAVVGLTGGAGLISRMRAAEKTPGEDSKAAKTTDFGPVKDGQTPSASDKEDKKKDEKKAPTAKQASAGENILRNGGFEEGDQTPSYWSQGAEIEGVEYIWDKKTGQKGTASVCLRKTANRYFPIAQWYQVVDRKGDQPALRVAAQVKAEGVTKAIIDVQFLDEKEEALGHKWAAYIGAKAAGDPAVSHDWKEYAGRVEIPPGTKKLQVGLQVYGPGQVWFDEVRAEYER